MVWACYKRTTRTSLQADNGHETTGKKTEDNVDGFYGQRHERLLEWFGLVTRGPLGQACRQIMDMKPPGKRPRTMWMDSMDRDMKDYRNGLGLLQEDH